MPSGIIIKGIGGFYYVKIQDDIYECKARGIFRKGEKTPLPGDRVNITVIDDEKRTGSVDEIIDRESEFISPAVANVNQLAAVIAARSPAPDLGLLDKLLITASVKDIDSIILINKIDLDESGEYKRIADAYSKTGYKVILLTSAINVGFDALANEMQGKITVFAGQSGVGKSTILNRIFNSSVMKTGEISSKVERGKHTTRHAELVELESGGFVVDTPGFSSYELCDIPYGELELYYPEFEGYLNTCRFSHCSHISEPFCTVREAVDKGDISKDRYLRYAQFYSTLKKQEDFKYKK